MRGRDSQRAGGRLGEKRWMRVWRAHLAEDSREPHGDAKTRTAALEVVHRGQGHTAGQALGCELPRLRAGALEGKDTEDLKVWASHSLARHSSSLSCAGLDTLLLPHPPLWSLFSSKSSVPYPVLSTHPSLTTECSLQTSPVPTRGGSLMQASQHHTEGATWHLLPWTGPSDPSPHPWFFLWLPFTMVSQATHLHAR